jgi:quercetin dioxygenase-like cupin family protein
MKTLPMIHMKGLTVVLLAIAVSACGQAAKQEQDASGIFPKGNRTANDNFSGVVWVHMIVPTDTTYNTQIATVTFEPGVRTRWHYHPSGQILMITSGTAYYQEKGKPKQILQKGDVAKCPPNVPHWHGAAPGGLMSHVAVSPKMEKGAVVWLEKVTEQEYGN